MRRFAENNVCIENTNLITSIRGMYARRVEAKLDQNKMLVVVIDFEVQQRHSRTKKVTIKLRGDEISRIKRTVWGKQREKLLFRRLRLTEKEMRDFFELEYTLTDISTCEESYYLVNNLTKALIRRGKFDFKIDRGMVKIGYEETSQGLVMWYKPESSSTCSIKITQGRTILSEQTRVPYCELLGGISYLETARFMTG